jgi:hypothetical protein
MPAHPAPHAYLASAYALKGETERAAAELAEARRLVGEDRFSSIAHVRAFRRWGCRRLSSCSKPHISPVCARPECRRNDRHRRFAVIRRSPPREGRSAIAEIARSKKTRGPSPVRQFAGAPFRHRRFRFLRTFAPPVETADGRKSSFHFAPILCNEKSQLFQWCIFVA